VSDASETLLYLDTSALYKLVIAEAESAAFRSFLASWSVHVTSDLARVELIRAVRRAAGGIPAVETQARQVLERCDVLPLTGAMLQTAGTAEPPSLRSLDAIHLVSAQSLGVALGGLVTYDDRLAEAARAAGIAVFTPR
jgi:hypothetical protein